MGVSSGTVSVAQLSRVGSQTYSYSCTFRISKSLGFAVFHPLADLDLQLFEVVSLECRQVGEIHHHNIIILFFLFTSAISRSAAALFSFDAILNRCRAARSVYFSYFTMFVSPLFVRADLSCSLVVLFIHTLLHHGVMLKRRLRVVQTSIELPAASMIHKYVFDRVVVVDSLQTPLRASMSRIKATTKHTRHHEFFYLPWNAVCKLLRNQSTPPLAILHSNNE